MPALVLEFYPNGNINEFVKQKSLNDEAKFSLIKEVALGMKYLHEFDTPTIHGDIRGANVLIDVKGHAVLADYGLVFIIDSTDFTTTKIVGTCRWTAPELMVPPENEEEYASTYSFSSDVFAFAMTIIEVFTEQPPFAEKKSDSAALFAIIGGKRPELPACIRAQGLATLVERCWDSNPKTRPSADEICRTLEPVCTVPSWTRFFRWLSWPIFQG